MKKLEFTNLSYTVRLLWSIPNVQLIMVLSMVKKCIQFHEYATIFVGGTPVFCVCVSIVLEFTNYSDILM